MKHLKKINALILLSDGSSVDIHCFNCLKEFLLDYDIRSTIKTLYNNIESFEDFKKRKDKFGCYMLKTLRVKR